ncbi:MAG: T9SS type A sorting domain-containing protein, partial [Fibrobacteres bacterium]|nr:T9SS type A sorting domain-containing protein [Fibrobacterota bacterium]
NLSETLPDSVYSGRFTQSDTFHADPEHGYPKDIIHYSSVSQYQMIKKGVSARFDALIRPFADSSVPQPVSFRRTGGDTLVLAVDSITYWVHAPTKTAGIYPSNVFAEDDDLIERSMSLTVSPNPYNPVCRINFYVPMSGKGSLTLYDCRGSKVSELVSGNINRGNHALTLNALSANGKGFASGVYLLRLRTAFGELKQKIILAQ